VKRNLKFKKVKKITVDLSILKRERFRPSNVIDRFITISGRFMNVSGLENITNGRKRPWNDQANFQKR
jgi:hypothetical protein